MPRKYSPRRPAAYCGRCGRPCSGGHSVCFKCTVEVARRARRAARQERQALQGSPPCGRGGLPPDYGVLLLNIPYPTPEEEQQMDKILRQRAAEVRGGWSPETRDERMQIYPMRRPA